MRPFLSLIFLTFADHQPTPRQSASLRASHLSSQVWRSSSVTSSGRGALVMGHAMSAQDKILPWKIAPVFWMIRSVDATVSSVSRVEPETLVVAATTICSRSFSPPCRLLCVRIQEPQQGATRPGHRTAEVEAACEPTTTPSTATDGAAELRYTEQRSLWPTPSRLLRSATTRRQQALHSPRWWASNAVG
jgi:hypothetical protein